MTMVSCPLCGIEAYDYIQLYDALSVMVKDPACPILLTQTDTIPCANTSTALTRT